MSLLKVSLLKMSLFENVPKEDQSPTNNDCVSVRGVAAKTADGPNDHAQIRKALGKREAERRTWILSQLEEGVKLTGPMVTDNFGCTMKTVRRVLKQLREEGTIERVGSPRHGYYRLIKSK